jgi:hypothetical protein
MKHLVLRDYGAWPREGILPLDLAVSAESRRLKLALSGGRFVHVRGRDVLLRFEGTWVKLQDRLFL